MRFSIKIILITLMAVNFLQGQNSQYAYREPIYFWGFYGDFNINRHIADFEELPGFQTCCPQFVDGKGYGPSFGGLFEVPINDAIVFNLRLGYSGLNGTLLQDDTIGNTAVAPIDDPNNLYLTSAIVTYDIDANVSSIGIEPTMGLKFFKDAMMEVGLRAAYLVSSTMSYAERLKYPEGVTFINGRTVRNDSSDFPIPDTKKFQLHGTLGINYRFPVGKDMYLVPEMRYFMPFTNISSVQWKVASVQFGASLKIPVYPDKSLPTIDEERYVRDTVVTVSAGIKEPVLKLKSENVERRKDTTSEAIINLTLIKETYELKLPKQMALKASLKVTGIAKDGTRSENPTIVIEELETEEGFPLLPFVFFQKGGNDLTKSGLNLLTEDQTATFSEAKLPWNTLKIYSDFLNILAERMQNNKKSTIVITGCNNNQAEENVNVELSERRALAVRDYLINIWKIDPKRITIEKRNLPEKPGNALVPDGIEENQRAEISSNDLNLLRPVILKEITRTPNPPVIEIEPVIQSAQGIGNWNIAVSQQGQRLRYYEGKNTTKKANWIIEEEPLPKLDNQIDMLLIAEDTLGNQTTVAKETKIEQLTIKKKRYELRDDKRIERFSLILFDYDKADITPRQKLILDEIKKRIKPNSKVIIEGFADRTGQPDYNRDLAARRIDEVRKMLDLSPDRLVINAIGSDRLIYDNNIPQGRGYCRTVQITIETPVMEE